ncbi:hypothetical protein CMI46_00215 [Candidatus Pacearchaeota archaeon]|nr:hypothetical protein [Candidatus Pacearchaeota archaeon]|tara:strand:- start:344 stop:877 length:534 start_codon:yes stop_codon:yes gene_type:complete
MKIDNYEFIAYDKSIIKHLKRHLAKSNVPGSYFKKDIFPTSKDLIDFAIKQIDSYHGRKKVINIKMNKIIGYDSIISKNKVPSGIKIIRKKREKEGFYFNFVKGLNKKPTKNLVIIIGPLSSKRHGILTIFPGKNHPPLPKTKKQLKNARYTGVELEKKLSENKKLFKKWSKLVFIL